MSRSAEDVEHELDVRMKRVPAIKAIVYATSALGYAAAGDYVEFNASMGAAAHAVPFEWEFNSAGAGTARDRMLREASRLLDAIGDYL